MIKPIVLCLTTLLPFSAIQGQCDTLTISRLNESLLLLEENATKADTLNELAWVWKECDLKKALTYADGAQSLSRNLDYQKGLGDNFMIRGLMAEKEADIPKADSLYHQALATRLQLGNMTNVAKVYNNLGALYLDFGRPNEAIPFYEKGLALFDEIKVSAKSDRSKAKIHNNLGNAYSQIGLYEQALEHFEESLKIRNKNNDYYATAQTHFNIGTLYYEDAFTDTRASRKHLEKSLEIFETYNDSKGMARCYLNLGNLLFLQNQIDSAYLLYQKALNTGWLSAKDNVKAKKSIGRVYFEKKAYKIAIDTFTYCLEELDALNVDDEVAKLYADIGNAHYELEDYPNALKNLKKSLALFDQTKLSKFKIDVLEGLSFTYSQLGKYEEAFQFSNASLEQRHELDKSIQKAINYRVKLSEEKKRSADSQLKLSNLETENEMKQLYFTGFLILTVLGLILSIVGFLAYYNRKKRQLAEKNVTLASQKVDVLIKEQALKSTFARLEGIEQERKRIAKELHDQIGVMLSTAKLYFAPMDAQVSELDEKDQNKYQKATQILDDAYKEVRRISHNMASPSLTEFGLVGELQLLAQRIEASQKLKIKVQAHEMEERLDNKIEIGLYYIIQELITNALKHAQASEINIQLNHFGDLVNVMIEDNGIGFDYERSKQKKGMGLNNIYSRVKNLNGTLDIDSGIGRGTTITLDIPM